MSNETPQEKHPKFYKDPHLWIGAIDIKCLKVFMLDSVEVKEGTMLHLTPYLLWQLGKKVDYIEPRFKPQEGEKFIKDLESAVDSGNIFNYKLSYKEKDKNGHYLFTGDKDGHPLLLTVNSAKLSMVAYAVGKDLIALPIDTSAYVTTLLKLGYYL